MDIYEYAKKIIAYAKDQGIDDCEIYHESSKSLNIGVFNKQIDGLSIDKTRGIGFRGIFKGKMGYSYTEIFNDESIKLLVDNVIDNAQLIDNDEVEVIYGEKCDYVELNSYNENIDKAAINAKKKLPLELEKAILNLDNRIDKVASVGYKDNYAEISIINSKGINISYKSNISYLYSEATAKDGDTTIYGYDYEYNKSFADIDVMKLANKIVDKIASKYGAIAIPSKNYKIILEKNAASSLLRTFSGIFSADAAQKGMSLLSGKEGEIISTNIVNLVDDPHLDRGINSKPFDDEGVATYRKAIIEKGCLKTLLHNLKTATKQGIKTTGNAAKGSFKSPISVSPTNLYIENGDNTMEEMWEAINNGLLITEFQGLHAGASPITGNFSLASKGYLIENGKKTKAIEQVTLAGNFYDMLKSITMIGNDLEFRSSVVSPSLCIGELSVAGRHPL